MKTFHLTCKLGISAYTIVEANNLEDAIEIANDRQLMQIVNSGDTADDTWMVDELDGTPYDIHED
jgi:hypothetical protein